VECLGKLKSERGVQKQRKFVCVIKVLSVYGFIHTYCCDLQMKCYNLVFISRVTLLFVTLTSANPVPDSVYVYIHYSVTVFDIIYVKFVLFMKEYNTNNTKNETTELNSIIKFVYSETQLYTIWSQFNPHHIVIIYSSDINFNILICNQASHLSLPCMEFPLKFLYEFRVSSSAFRAILRLQDIANIVTVSYLGTEIGVLD
jgi:hypothetical protein